MQAIDQRSKPQRVSSVIEIPHTRLGEDVLKAVIEEFILREGTDYGAQEISLDAKLAQVRRQLETGEVLITFDPRTEDCTLMTRHQFKHNAQVNSAEDEVQGSKSNEECQNSVHKGSQ